MLVEIFGCMHPFPTIAGIKYFSIIRIFQLIKFTQPKQMFQGINLRSCFLPKTHFHPRRQIATESIDIGFFHPIFHGIDHCFPHRRIAIIKFNYIIHSTGHQKIVGWWIFQVIFRVLFRPNMIPSRMISHPINEHFEALLVRFLYKCLEIAQRSKFGIDCCIIRAGVLTAHRTLLVFLCYRRYWHKPKRFYAHIFQPRQFL